MLNFIDVAREEAYGDMIRINQKAHSEKSKA